MIGRMELQPLEIKPAPFRKDLTLFPGPAEQDGTPTYTLFDPLKGQYYKISWVQAIVMRIFKTGMTLNELLTEVNRRSTLKIEKEQLEQIFLNSAQLGLLAINRSSEEVQKRSDSLKQGWFMWLIMHYLYIRIPLFNPDRFLEKTIPFVAPFFSQTAKILAILAVITGFAIVALHFDQYVHTFTYFFNLEGLIAYGFAIFTIKSLHELGHAYTAKYFKIHVPTMGFAFLVLFPVLYTNVTDAWKLQSRRERFLISAAGVIVELVLAGIASIGWILTEPGLLHSMFFLVSSTTWITSLLLNCNPAMRFDGYYLLTDLVGIDNLQQRSFAVARWKLREWFLGLNIPPPEEDLPPSRVKIMLIYSIYTWIYRIILYTAIALFVYYEFTKALGIFLFIVEVIFFIMAPFFSEFKQLAYRKRYFNWNIRALITGTISAIFLAWFILPFPHKKTFQAISEPAISQNIYSPEAAVVEKIYVKRGDSIQENKPLIKLHSDVIENTLGQVQAEIDRTKQEIEVLGIDEQGKPYLNSKKAFLSQKESELHRLKEKQELLLVKAEVSGTLYDWSELLREGLSISKGTLIGKIADLSKTKVFAFVPEAESEGLEMGSKARFRVLNPSRTYTGIVNKVYKTAADTLNYPQLSSIYKGPLAVVPDRKKAPQDVPKMHLLEGYYLVEITLDPTEDPPRFGKTGVAEVQGPWESKLYSYIKKAKRLIWKESGF